MHVSCSALLPVFEYWQFWRNTADADVIRCYILDSVCGVESLPFISCCRFLKLFTEVPIEKIRELENLTGSELNDVKVLLADEATAMLHGRECLPDIHATVASLFQEGGGGSEALDSLTKLQLDPSDMAPDKSIWVVEVLLRGGMVSSKNEGRRLIRNKGVRINDEVVVDERTQLSADMFDSLGRMKLSSGKKTHMLILLPK